MNEHQCKAAVNSCEATHGTPCTSNHARMAITETRSRGLNIFLGILLMLIGLAAMVFAVVSSVVTTLFIAWTMVIAGVVELVIAFRATRGREFVLKLLLGILYCGLGLYTLFYPLVGTAALTLTFAILLLVDAGLELGLAFHLRGLPGWGWILFDAIITGLLGIFIVARWPSSSFWVLGTFVGVSIFITGLARVAHSGEKSADVLDMTGRRAA